MASPPPPASHLASLLQGLAGSTPIPSPAPPSPASPGGGADVNDLLRLLSGGGGPASGSASAAPPPPPSALSPASPPPSAAAGSSLLDLLIQKPNDQHSSSPARSIGSSGLQQQASPAARSDLSLAGSPGGKMGGTSLMEMLLGGLPLGSQTSPAGQPPHLPIETPQSPPPATSMNPLVSPPQAAGGPAPLSLSTGFTTPSPPPSDSLALRIEPQPQPVAEPPIQVQQAPAAMPQVEQQQAEKPRPVFSNFVSPFDAAFGKRSKSANSVSASASAHGSARVSSPAAAAPAVPRSTSVHALPSSSSTAIATDKLAPNLFPPAPTPPTPSIARGASPTLSGSPAKSRTAATAQTAPAAENPLGHRRVASGVSAVKKDEVFPSGRWKAKDLQTVGGAAPISAPARDRFSAIDVSQPNPAALVTSEDVMRRCPITLLPSELVYAPGCTVDGTTYISYHLNKDRVRLIDKTTGARALLQLPTEWHEWHQREAQIVDLTTHGGLVAVVTSDGGLIVWRVPTSWTQDEPECSLVYATAPTDDDATHLKLVRWFSPTHLAVASRSSVWFLDVEHLSAGWSRRNPVNLASIKAQPFGCRIDGEGIVDFAVHPAADGATQVAILSLDGSLALYLIDAAFGTRQFFGGTATGDAPSSVELLDSDLLLLGTAKGTTLRLFSLSSAESGDPDFTNPLDELRFTAPDATPMFNKLAFDSQRSLLFVGNSARCSLFAFKLSRGSTAANRAVFGRVLEFPLDEALAGFVVEPLDFEAFTVSPSGIDMLRFSAEEVDRLFASDAPASPAAPPMAAEDVLSVVDAAKPPVQQAPSPPPPVAAAPKALEVPASEDVPVASARVEDSAAKSVSVHDAAHVAPQDSDLSSALQREMSKLEENIVSRLKSSLQLQSDKLEATDLRRQERIFAVLSQELSANQSSLVTDAVKAELSSSVLPALSAIVQGEVRSVVQREIARGLAEAVNSRTVFLTIDKAIKDLVGKTLIPSYDAATADMGAALTRQVREDMINIRKEIVREQSGALVETNDLLSEMAGQIQALGRQVAELQSTVVSLQQQVVAIPQHPRQTSPESMVKELLPQVGSHHLHQHHQHQPHAKPNHISQGSFSSTAPFGNPPSIRSPVPIPTMPIYPSSLAYPQPQPLASAPPPPFPPSSAAAARDGSSFPVVAPVTDWGDAFTEAFLSPDPGALAALTRRIGGSLDAVLPDVAPDARAFVGPEGRGPLSQAVLLTTIHKFTESLPRAFANTADFASAIVVIARAARLLDTSDATILPYAHRVIAQVIPALARAEDMLVQGRSAGPAAAMSDNARAFFVSSLRGVRNDLAVKTRG